ncbi:MAG TPA: hypothetical protein VM911_14225 [Pyrinomonadaceae bacterium]|jgi:hypothetical protein|nr:hypothetical protein [Pyrinomonadaceae bacterium]
MSLYFSLSKSIVGRVFITLIAALLCALCSLVETSAQQRRRVPITNRSAVVVDERLAVLRDGPELSARLLQRMSRGRVVLILGTKRTSDGLTFYRVAVTRRTGGWLQSEAVVSPGRSGDDERLLRLIRGSEDFDRVVRARIFLDLFPRSPARPQVLSIYAEAAEAAATRLSRDASRRLNEREMAANGAPLFSYYLSYSGLDRYRRQGITFTFNRASKQFHYDGESWREILRRYPRSPEAEEARKRLDALSTNSTQ